MNILNPKGAAKVADGFAHLTAGFAWCGKRRRKIADELYLTFGIKHSPETIRKYRLPRRGPRDSQTWHTFVKNHAKEIFACDFLAQHTIPFRVFNIFAVMEVGSRRIVHFNITEHPTLEWVKMTTMASLGSLLTKIDQATASRLCAGGRIVRRW